VHIIKLVASVRYRIDDVRKWGYRYTDPEQLLQCAAYREMTAYGASATLDRPVSGGESPTDRPEALMTYGRATAARELRKRIQAAVDRLDLGVKVLYVDFLSVHPPAEAAPAYEEVLLAEREMIQKRFRAEAEANRRLVEVAGAPERAWELALAIRTVNNLSALADMEADRDTFLRRLDEHIAKAKLDLQRVELEIERLRELGKIQPGSRSPQQVLRDRYREYLAELEEIRTRFAASEPVDLGERLAAARRRANDLFARAEGEPAAMVAQARGRAAEDAMAERARAESFQRDLAIYRINPKMFMLDRWLDVLDESLPGMRKYVLGMPREQIELWLNMEEQSGPLDQILDAASANK
jgi:regulator of protease activity HflC (stomatin/prohibitin superfamily)